MTPPQVTPRTIGGLAGKSVAKVEEAFGRAAEDSRVRAVQEANRAEREAHEAERRADALDRDNEGS
jgi:hypothetical protein